MANLEILPFLFLLSIIYAYASENCPISMCSSSSSSIPVRFPFRLAGLQPQFCGYPGFNLSCNNQSKTVINLPYSGYFLVRGIDYATQQIQLYDPENCLPQRLLSLNLSSSPFVPAAYQNYTLLSCPTQFVESRFIPIGCLSNSTTSVIATSSLSIATSLSTSCRIIITLPIPVSWPVEYNEGFSNELTDDLKLTWYTPACEECEAKGGICGFATNSSQVIGCFNYYKTGASTNGLQILKVICLTIAAPSLAFALGIVTVAFLLCKGRPRTSQANQNLTTTAAGSPQHSIAMVGLDEGIIESYEKVVLGESMRLPEGANDGTCAICLSEYHSKDTLRCIPECNHCFHVECIDEWLRINSSCPVCRKFPTPVHHHVVPQSV